MSTIIRVRDTIHKIKYTESSLKVNLSTPLSYLAPEILKNLSLNSEKVKIRDIKFFLIKGNEKKEIQNFDKSLKDFNFDEKTDCLQLEKKGFELSSQFCISLAYSGPILFFLYFYICNSQFFNLKLHIIFILGILHYLKRIYETNFVHIYGKSEFPFFSGEFFGLIFYYWILFGFSIGYFTLNSDYAKGNSHLEWSHYIAIILHIYSEFNNYKSHMILRNLKLHNSGNRGIPNGNMFNFVTNSHYFWELMSWIGFFLFVRNWASFLFVIYSFISMASLSYEKHKNLKNYFGENFPKHLKAFIPFIF